MSFLYDNDSDEDTILSKLRIYARDGIGLSRCLTHFVNVSSLKEFRITADSDTDLMLQLQWSIDGIEPNFCTDYPIEANKCLSKQIDVVLQYVRFFIEEGIGEKQNCRLKIFSFSADDKPIQREQHKKSLFSLKSFSPKSSPKSSPSKSKKRDSIADDRIPFNVYKGSLLVGKNARELTVLPKGNECDVLITKDGMPQWVSVLTLFSLYDDAQRKEREKFIQCPTPLSSPVSPTLLSSPNKLPRSKSSLTAEQLNAQQISIDIDEDEEEQMDGIYDISVSPKQDTLPKKRGLRLSSVIPATTTSRPNDEEIFNYCKKPLPLPPAFQ